MGKEFRIGMEPNVLDVRRPTFNSPNQRVQRFEPKRVSFPENLSRKLDESNQRNFGGVSGKCRPQPAAGVVSAAFGASCRFRADQTD